MTSFIHSRVGAKSFWTPTNGSTRHASYPARLALRLEQNTIRKSDWSGVFTWKRWWHRAEIRRPPLWSPDRCRSWPRSVRCCGKCTCYLLDIMKYFWENVRTREYFGKSTIENGFKTNLKKRKYRLQCYISCITAPFGNIKIDFFRFSFVLKSKKYFMNPTYLNSNKHVFFKLE